MALTISTGFVVDDAIVMIENIARYVEEGEPPLQAALKGAEQIGFTIVSLTVSLIAVLIPLLFMGDIVGRLFREFAVTLSVTILVSAVVSLTLTPMMCARHAAAHAAEQRGPAVRARRSDVFERVDRRLRPDADVGAARTRRATLLVFAGDARARRCYLFYRRAEGLLPGAGYRRDHRRLRGAADGLVPRAWRSGSRRWRTRCSQDPAVESLSSFIGVDGTNVDAEQRAHPDQPEAARRSGDRRQRRHPAPAAAAAPTSTGITLYMQPVQDLTVEDRVSRTQYQFSLEHPDRGAAELWAPTAARRAAARAGSCSDVASDQQNGGSRADARHRPRHGVAVRHHARRRSTTRSTTRSASGRSRRSSRS